MNRGRQRAVGILGLAALACMLCLAPWIQGWIRGQILLRRLEAHYDPEAARELADAGREEWILPRFQSAAPGADSRQALAWNIIFLARVGKASSEARRAAFEAAFPPHFSAGPMSALSLPPELLEHTTLTTARKRGAIWDVVYVGEWSDRTYGVEPRVPGDVQAYVEWFVDLNDPAPRLVYGRCSWLIFPAAAGGLAGSLRVETEDLTDVPDPLQLYLRPPARAGGTGERGVELRVASLGTWRQFIPKRYLFDQSVSYEVLLELGGGSAPPREPLRLGTIAVAADTAAGRWFAASAAPGAEPTPIDRGAHLFSFWVPASATEIEPLDRIHLLFRPLPSFAESCGFRATAGDSPPFDRWHYVPAFEQ